MSAAASPGSGGNVHRLDPARQTHYAISEFNEYRVGQVAAGMAALGDLLDLLDPEADIPDRAALAALCRTCSYALDGAMAERVVVFPGKKPSPKVGAGR